MLVTLCHRWAWSCRFEHLQTGKGLLKSITKNTVRKDDHSFNKICFWFTKRPCFSPKMINISFWKKVYLKRELCWGALIYPWVHLKPCSVVAQITSFGHGVNKTRAQSRHPDHYFNLDRIHPLLNFPIRTIVFLVGHDYLYFRWVSLNFWWVRWNPTLALALTGASA